MILNNVRLIGNREAVSIRISDGKIAEVADAPLVAQAGTQVVFVNDNLFPGLINSHDHLDFNLFPKLGNRTYKNYTEWGKYLHETFAGEIAAGLKIPLALREKWGIYKNLLCGVTTVVNHGERIVDHNSLVTVFEKTQDLHSIRFEQRWKQRLNNLLKLNLPVVIHAGEGTDAAARQEIDQLITWNLLHRKLIGIHGVSLTPSQAKAFSALVWCPQSNYFLLNATAPVNRLKKHTRILFGTDSTLTSDWDIWVHIALARNTGMLNDEELYNSLTNEPAGIWKLNTGTIREGMDADLIVSKNNGATGLDAFYSTRPNNLLMVMHKGDIKLFDQALYHQLNDIPLHRFSKVYSGDSIKYVQGDIHGLMNEIKTYKADANFPVYLPSEPAA
jgi:cytosine/adenosine deaminase-related metal-dependent hydrolase